MRNYAASSVLGVSLLTTALAATCASAAPLAAGQSALPVFENQPVGGTVLATLPAPFATANYTGTVVCSVIQGDTSNTFGGLTFTYQIVNDPTSANSLTRLTTDGFAAYLTDVSYKAGTGTTAPSGVDRANTDTVGWTFLGAPLGLGTIGAGTSSELLVVQTNATNYTFRPGNISNGAVTSMTILAPSGAITPEPATLSAVAGGLMVLGRRRRA